MAGGAGTRLWPMSRLKRPKQLLPFIGGRSLLELAAGRLEGVVERSRRLVCTAEAFRGAVRAALPGFGDAQILGEPVGRDTLNAVGFSAAVLAKEDANAVFAVLTSDHLIEPQGEFARALQIGFELAEADPNRFVTFSITPTFAATGYGYVERGDAVAGFEERAFHAKRFVEKPDRARAEEYLRLGTFGWNSGMFVFHAGTVMETLKRLMPETAEGLGKIATAWGTSTAGKVIGAVYPTLKKISVDYALMEPAAKDATLRVCTVPMAVNWKDVGSWPTYGAALESDQDGNRGNGPTVHLGSKGVLAVTEDSTHTIATIGCEDLIVVHTKDATLVCPASMAEKVKEMAGLVGEALR